MTDLVQVIDDVLASVDPDRHATIHADRGLGWSDAVAQSTRDLKGLRALRDHIERDRAEFAAFRGETRHAGAGDVERAFLDFCREWRSEP